MSSTRSSNGESVSGSSNGRRVTVSTWRRCPEGIAIDEEEKAYQFRKKSFLSDTRLELLSTAVITLLTSVL